MTRAAAVKISPSHALQIESGLSDLRCACVCLQNLIGNGGEGECSAILALVQKAGAYIETALRDAAILDGPAVVGDASEWLDMPNSQEESA
jgi:hypothetical protein